MGYEPRRRTEMASKRHTPEQIVAKLRQVDVLTSQGTSVAEAIRSIGVTEVTYRDELLDGEIFSTLTEAQIVIETWRRPYNMIRPHSALGYQPPAPEVVMPARSAAQPRPASPSALPLAQRPTLN